MSAATLPLLQRSPPPTRKSHAPRLFLAGILLVTLGTLAFTGALDFTHDAKIVEISDLSVSMKEQKTLLQWVGVVGIAIGLGLIGMGALRK